MNEAEEKEVARIREDLRAFKENCQKLGMQIAQYSAEAQHWRAEYIKQGELAKKTVKELVEWMHRIVNDASKLVQEKAGHCKDCDVKALLQKIDGLRPAQVGEGK